ncbi:protein phosphatase 2C, partial [Angomonas deanei]
MSFLDLIINYVVSRNDMATYSNALRRADIMSEPITKKVTEKGENEYLAFASSCMQGWRRSMEDSHTNVLLGNGGFFGVYDGHSGAETAKFCGANMYDYVARSDAFSKGDYTSALHDGFISLDKHLHSLPNHEKSGCTACVLYFANDQLYCANAGDSRCVLCRNGEAFPLSNDHKPYLESEQARIERAGGYIWNRRVNG